MTECELESESFDEEAGKHIVEFDPDTAESVTTQLASAVADATDREVTELPPLGEWVDCDALEQLFDGHEHRAELSVSFDFEGCQVFVSSVGRIVVEPETSKPV